MKENFAVINGIETLINRDFVKDNIYVAVQKSSTERIVKTSTDFEGIEKYLMIRVEGISSKVTEELLMVTDVSAEEAWKYAENNSHNETVIKSMSELLSEMGFPLEESETLPLYVISNKVQFKGASAVLDRKALEEFGRHHNADEIIVLPSSIHEMIIVPKNECDTDIEELSMLVELVNSSVVSETDRLTDRAYTIKL